MPNKKNASEGVLRCLYDVYRKTSYGGCQQLFVKAVSTTKTFRKPLTKRRRISQRVRVDVHRRMP